eukprot:8051112-Pyramimonas_sp.AAC.1
MGMTEAAPVQGPPELRKKSLQTSAGAEGDALGFMAVRSTESYSMASASDEEFEGEGSISDPTCSWSGCCVCFGSAQRAYLWSCSQGCSRWRGL